MWDLAGLIFIFYQGILSPYRICFNDLATGGVAIFEIFQDLFFILDMFVSFNTGILEDGTLVMLRVPITINYIKMWFWIDLIASFPYSLVLSYQDYFDINSFHENNINKGVLGNAPQLLRILKFARIMRILRVLRVVKISKFILKVNVV